MVALGELTDDDWAEWISKYAHVWFDENGFEVTMEPAQAQYIQNYLAKAGVTPEQRKLKTRDLPEVKIQVFNGLFAWCSAYFHEYCPNCEKSKVEFTAVDGEVTLACSNACGWTGDRRSLLRVRKSMPQ